MEKKKKSLTGKVVSDKMQKTATIRVNRVFEHPVFYKIVRRSKLYKAHDEENRCRIGDTVRIIEVKPMSKTKRWSVLEIIDRAE